MTTKIKTADDCLGREFVITREFDASPIGTSLKEYLEKIEHS